MYELITWLIYRSPIIFSRCNFTKKFLYLALKTLCRLLLPYIHEDKPSYLNRNPEMLLSQIWKEFLHSTRPLFSKTVVNSFCNCNIHSLTESEIKVQSLFLRAILGLFWLCASTLASQVECPDWSDVTVECALGMVIGTGNSIWLLFFNPLLYFHDIFIKLSLNKLMLPLST